MDFFRKNPPLNQRSQIAVIITFVIAVIILFTVVFINITKVSQVKTTTSTAADKAALGLASQLGSISHYYKEKVLKGKTEICGPSWLALILVAVGTVVIVPFVPAIIVAGIPAAAIISSSMLGSIDNRFKDMTLYNRLREEALFQALLSMQSDDVELKNTGSGGIFHDDSTGQDYDLSAIPAMRNEKKASRFAAWYYNKRLPLVSDDNLKTALDIFTNGLKRFIITDDWDNDKWRINKFSYFIKPGPADYSADYQITCVSPGCPDWVKDSVAGKITIMKIDATQPEGPTQVIGGFLEDKFFSLLSRLTCGYSLSFCSSLAPCDPDAVTASAICSDVNNLIGDLRNFLIKTKGVVEMPVSTKFNNITQWLPFFYDFKLHNDNKGSKDNNNDGKIDNDDFSGDAYLRLTRDHNYIEAWITELETLNNNRIAPDIKKKHGECPWGRGSVVDSSSCNASRGAVCPPCDKPYCGGDDGEDGCCQVCCHNPQKCAWEGIYYTCCQDPPVCSSGDLYGDKPGWCSSRGNHAPCASGCPECNVQNFNCDDTAKSFQGRLAYDNTSGLTEVEQAIKILRALNYDIDNIKATIARLVDAINRGEPYIDENNNGVRDAGEDFTNLNGNTDSNGNPIYDYYLPDPSYRNEIIYAWQDKPKPDGSQQFLHLVRVKIGGYPVRLPNITESTKWIGLANCYTLNDYERDFSIITSRYDQDQPTDIGKTAEGGWQLRRRKTLSQGEKLDEFQVPQLNAMMKDIQATGIPQPDEKYKQADIDNLLNNYAITSCSTAHYGPEKSDIYITGTKCD